MCHQINVFILKTLRGYLHTIHTTIHTPMALKNLIHSKDVKSQQGSHSLSRLFRDPELKKLDSTSDDAKIIVKSF